MEDRGVAAFRTWLSAADMSEACLKPNSARSDGTNSGRASPCTSNTKDDNSDKKDAKGDYLRTQPNSASFQKVEQRQSTTKQLAQDTQDNRVAQDNT